MRQAALENNQLSPNREMMTDSEEAKIQIKGVAVRNKMRGVTFALVSGLCLCGCIGSLTSNQRTELKNYEAKGLMVEEKDPDLGAVLGFLPGGGSFYTRHYGLGVINLLLWPTSVLWDPVNGYTGSLKINYLKTELTVNEQKIKETEEIDAKLRTKEFSTDEYLLQKEKINQKYSPDID